MPKKSSLIFIIIFFLALILRFYDLGVAPPALNWDEVSHGYTSYSLLKTGQDQWGQSWPIFNFRAYGDYPTTANVYLTIPFVRIFGLNSLSIRLPHAIFSLLFCLTIYFLTQHLFKNRSLSLFAFFISAIIPWSIFPGRGVFQSNLSQLFLTLGLLFFLKKKPLSLLFFGLSLYSYHNTRIIIPVLLPALFIFYNPKFKSGLKLIFFVAIFLILAIPNLLNLFSPESQSRNRWVGIINPNSINLINESRRLYTGPEFTNRLVNNKVVFFAKEFSINYLNLFNPLPIFFNGSANYQFNPPNTPLIYPVFLPFFYLGLIVLFKKHRPLLLLFLICLLPSALTVGDFPSIRATSALPFYILSIVAGLSVLKNKILYLAVILISIFSLYSYLQKYHDYNYRLSFTWQYGYEQLVSKLKTVYSDYDKIYITKKYGEPHQFILFYWPWDPSSYLTDGNKNTDFHSDWYWVDSFDKFIFINDWEVKDLALPPHTLLVSSPNNPPATTTSVLDTIYYPDNSKVFELYDQSN